MAPGRNRYWPLTTMRSPAFSPLVTMVMSSALGPASMGRFSTVLSGLTTQAKTPCELRCMAAEGMVTAFFSVFASTRTRTNSPGHSRSSSLGKEALRRMVLVNWSIWLSMSSSVPLASSRVLS